MRTRQTSLISAIAVIVAGPVLAAAGVAPAPVTAAPLASVPLAVWEMNEPPGSRTMVDSSGNGRHGTVGTSVITGSPTGTGLGYRWKFRKPTEPPAEPERLVVVPDQAGLDPGDQDFTLTFRFRTTHSFGNYLQKGQATTKGGQIKVQAPKGIVGCLFRGSEGRSATRSKTPLNDGQWHTIVCRRDDTGVTMYVDGEFRNRNRNPTGYIDNTYPWTIGGKINCDQIKVTCDYFSGEMDYVRLDIG